MKKKRKAQTNQPKAKWSVWKTIVSVFAGVFLITGATVLGVYVAGGFKERVVNPESITIDYGALHYNNNQIEISGGQENDSFMLTITSPTIGVTTDKVYLSLSGTNPITEINGMISDTVIQIPKIVSLNTPFEVKLIKSRLEINENEYTDWINGGISTITAQSEYNQISNTKIKIAVDTPVYEIKTSYVDLNGNPITKVDAGGAFKVQTTFVPASSQYMFADNKNTSISDADKRVKHAFHSTTSSSLTPYYESKFDMYFLASEEIAENISIRSYVFKNAQTELNQIASSAGDVTDQTFYTDMFRFLSANESSESQKGENNIDIATASIGYFHVPNKTITLNQNQSSFLYVNKYDDNSSYLGASIYSTNGQLLVNPLKYLALSFPEDSGITIEQGQAVEIDSKTYYLPFSGIEDKNFSNWILKPTTTGSVTVTVYLLEPQSGDTFEFFKVEGEIQKSTFIINVVQHQDKAPSFISTENEELILSVGADGKTISQTLNLADYVSVPSDNVYQDVVFFAYTTDYEKFETAIKNNFIGTTTINDKTMYVLSSETLTIYDACQFDLYFATVKPNDGNLNSIEGSIVKQCENYKTFIIKKELSNSSVDTTNSKYLAYENSSDAVDYEEKAVANIAQGATNDKIEVTFVINSDSYDVFKDAFDNEQITFEVKSEEIDVTDKFNILNSGIEINAIAGTTEYTLTYTLTLSSNAGLSDEISLTSFDLVYETGNITWSKALTESAAITLYKPTTKSIVVDNSGYKNALTGTAINIAQILTNDGTSQTITYVGNATALADNIPDFIGKLLPEDYITVTDNHDRIDTLAGKWKLVLLSGNGDLISVSGKSFSLKNIVSLSEFTIAVQAEDKDEIKGKIDSSDILIKIQATATGIDHLIYQTELKTTDNSMSENQSNINSVTVSKYGAKGQTLTMSDLIEFYLDNEGTQKYEPTNDTDAITYKFTSQYIYNLTPQDALDLYGEGGMITLNGTAYTATDTNSDGTTDGNDVKAWLEGLTIESITFNKNFAKLHPIYMKITSGNVLATNFTLNIESNVSVDADSHELYANVDGTVTATYTDNNTSASSGNLAKLYGNTTEKTYDVINKDGIFILSLRQGSEADPNSIATATIGSSDITIIFNDFWDKESENFTIYFRPEGDNGFAVNHLITFTVNRNLSITPVNKHFNLVNTTNQEALSFLTFERNEGSASLEDFKYSLTFSFEGNQLTVSDGYIVKNGTSLFEFAYNEKYKEVPVTVTYGNNTITTFNLKVTLGEDENWQSSIANKISALVGSETFTPEIQTVSDVTYLVYDVRETSGASWTLNSSFVETGAGDDAKTVYTIGYMANKGKYTLSSTTKLIFTSASQTLYGLGDESVYVKFSIKNSASTTIATVNVPIILSKVGATPVVYESGVVEGHELEYALKTPDKLFGKDSLGNDIVVCATMTAGAVNDLVDDEGHKGLVALLDTHKLAFWNGSLDKTTDSDIIKSINLSNKQISLNHLSDEEKYQDFYLPLVWTVGIGSDAQEFYYLIKVTPDVTVNGPVYAYDGDAEYIKVAALEEKTFDLGAAYNNTTKHNGETRFSIRKNMLLEEIYPQELYKVTKVEVGTTPYYSEDEWGSLFNTLSFNGSVLTINPKSSATMRITVTHSYPGASGADDLSVIGGEREYVLILNESTKDYGVQFGSETAVVKDGNEYEWTISNINAGTRDIAIKLVELSNDEITTTVYDKLAVVRTTDDDGIINDYSYNASQSTIDGVSQATLRLILNGYLSQDQTLTFACYTEYGLVATLKVTITANASAICNNSNLTGGQQYNFSNLFKISRDNETVDITSTSIIAETDKDWVKFENNQLKVSDLFKDTDVTATFTVTFNDGNTFTFSQTFHLTANVSGQTVNKQNVVANRTFTLNATDFVKDDTTNGIYTISIESSQYYGIDYNADKTTATITPNDVATETKITLTITITLTSPFGDNNKPTKQELTTTYEFTVLPSVVIEPNYPTPNGTELTKEYIDDGATYSSILAFFDSRASLSDASRLQIKPVTGKGDDGKLTTSTTKTFSSLTSTELENLTIVLKSIQYATLTCGGNEIKVNDKIGTNGAIVFNKVSGGDSIVVLTVTYQGVVQDYTIYIVDQAFAVTTNMATNNKATGDYETTTVNYEIVYVDKTSTENMFAQDRLVKVTLSSSITPGQYYFVFKNTVNGKDNFHVSYPVNILSSDAGKTITYDLGLSMAGKTFVGLYSAETLSDSTKFTISSDRKINVATGAFKLKDQTTGVELDTNATISDVFNATKYPYITDFKSMFGGTVTLLSRIQLTYAGYDVAYDTFKSSLESSGSWGILSNNNDLDVLQAQSAINYPSNPTSATTGATNKGVSSTYYFMPKLDIAVDAEASSKGNYITVTTNKEIESVVETFNIKHPTSGNLVTSAEFGGNTSITLSIVNSSDITKENNPGTVTLPNAYQNFGFKSNDSTRDYISYSLKHNSASAVYDFGLLPLGAKNDGDFVLIKLTYTTNGFTRDFYVVIEIMPDYVVTFGGSSGIDEGGLTSNGQNSIYAISTLATGENGTTLGYYTAFTLVGESGIVSVKHQYGNNTEAELSATNFAVTLTADQTIDEITFNDSDNLKNKLFASGTTTDTDWTITKEDGTEKIKKCSLTGSSEFIKVPAVVFGDQFYCIEGTDKYDFTYRFYFKLQNTTGSSPTLVTSSVSIQENGDFDIGANYEWLTISTETANNGITPITITAEPKTPVGTDGVTSILLQGINAWMFDGDPASESGTKYFEKADNNAPGYKNTGTDYILKNASDKKYLQLPTIANVKITEIKLLKNDGKTEINDNITGLTDTSSLATSSTGVFNGWDNSKSAIGKTFTMPKLSNTDLYGGGNVADIKMRIKLSYDGGKENFYLLIPVQVIRDITFQSNSTVVKDGVQFDLAQAGYGGTPIIAAEWNSTPITPAFVNDTLEVKVPANTSVSFNLNWTRASDNKTVTVSLNNDAGHYARTFYISISEKLGRIVNEDDTITLSIISGSAEIKYSGEDISTEITISIIENDCISLDHADAIPGDYVNITKYYVAKCSITPEGGTETNYYYRVSKQYYVTTAYYKIEHATTDEIDKVLEHSTTEFSTWAPSVLQIKDLVVDNEGKMSSKDNTPTDWTDVASKLYFAIAQDESNVQADSVNVDVAGNITYDSSKFTSENYVTINIFYKFGTTQSYKLLRQVRLGRASTSEDGNIIYNLGGGSFVSDDGDIMWSYNDGVTITLPTVTREGYTFDGWTCSRTDITPAEGNNKTWTATIESGTTGTITFVATWVGKIYYEANNGGTSTAETYSENSAQPQTVTLPVISYEGYTLDRWTCSNSAVSITNDGTTWTATIPAYTTGDITFSAVWIKTITYNSGNGSISGSKVETYIANHDKVQIISLPTVTRTGFTFKEWTCSNSAVSITNDGTTWTATIPENTTGDITFTAVWYWLFTYELDNSRASVIGYRESNFPSDGILIIPEKIQFGDRICTVTSIKNEAFKYCSGLTSITIPASVTTIEKNVFADCSNLSSVVIESATVYSNATGTSACGGLLANATTVKVLKTIVDGEGNSNSYLNNTEVFDRTEEGDYYIFTKK